MAGAPDSARDIDQLVQYRQLEIQTLTAKLLAAEKDASEASAAADRKIADLERAIASKKQELNDHDAAMEGALNTMGDLQTQILTVQARTAEFASQMQEDTEELRALCLRRALKNPDLDNEQVLRGLATDLNAKLVQAQRTGKFLSSQLESHLKQLRTLRDAGNEEAAVALDLHTEHQRQHSITQEVQALEASEKSLVEELREKIALESQQQAQVQKLKSVLNVQEASPENLESLLESAKQQEMELSRESFQLAQKCMAMEAEVEQLQQQHTHRKLTASQQLDELEWAGGSMQLNAAPLATGPGVVNPPATGPGVGNLPATGPAVVNGLGATSEIIAVTPQPGALPMFKLLATPRMDEQSMAGKEERVSTPRTMQGGSVVLAAPILGPSPRIVMAGTAPGAMQGTAYPPTAVPSAAWVAVPPTAVPLSHQNGAASPMPSSGYVSAQNVVLTSSAPAGQLSAMEAMPMVQRGVPIAGSRSTTPMRYASPMRSGRLDTNASNSSLGVAAAGTNSRYSLGPVPDGSSSLAVNRSTSNTLARPSDGAPIVVTTGDLGAKVSIPSTSTTVGGSLTPGNPSVVQAKRLSSGSSISASVGEPVFMKSESSISGPAGEPVFMKDPAFKGAVVQLRGSSDIAMRPGDRSPTPGGSSLNIPQGASLTASSQLPPTAGVVKVEPMPTTVFDSFMFSQGSSPSTITPATPNGSLQNVVPSTSSSLSAQTSLTGQVDSSPLARSLGFGSDALSASMQSLNEGSVTPSGSFSFTVARVRPPSTIGSMQAAPSVDTPTTGAASPIARSGSVKLLREGMGPVIAHEAAGAASPFLGAPVLTRSASAIRRGISPSSTPREGDGRASTTIRERIVRASTPTKGGIRTGGSTMVPVMQRTNSFGSMESGSVKRRGSDPSGSSSVVQPSGTVSPRPQMDSAQWSARMVPGTGLMSLLPVVGEHSSRGFGADVKPAVQAPMARPNGRTPLSNSRIVRAGSFDERERQRHSLAVEATQQDDAKKPWR